MKKIFIWCISLCLLMIQSAVFAHPLDISVSTATIKKDHVQITSYFHSFEIEHLLKKNGIIPDGVDYYFLNEQIIKDYIQQNISLKNNNKACFIQNIELKKDQTYEILTKGLGVDYSFKCSEKIENISLNIGYFIEFPLQTNRITFYNFSEKNNNFSPITFKVLTSKITQLNFNIYNKNISISTDSDNDGLSDEEEKIYFTDINNIDTDGDFYTDKQEVEQGWDPLNKELSPGQTYRESYELQETQNNNQALEVTDTIKYQNLGDYGYANGYLLSTMKYIDDFFTKNQGNIWYIFLIVFGLGVVHAIGPGHSKSLLVAYTLEKNHGYSKAIAFAAIFTVTHILDILLLFVITKIIVSFIDISKFNYYIQIVSAVLLFFLSIFLLYKAYKKKQCNHLEKNPEKTNLAIAFLAGLAPCSFAWSIFLLLLAVGKSGWIIPLVLALGLGIFTTLVSIVVLSIFLKNRIYNKAQNIAIYSSYLSAGIIFIISLILLYRIL